MDDPAGRIEWHLPLSAFLQGSTALPREGRYLIACAHGVRSLALAGACARWDSPLSIRWRADLPPSTPEPSGPDLAAAPHDVLVAGQLLDADRAARVETVGGNTDLRTHSELAAVGELC